MAARSSIDRLTPELRARLHALLDDPAVTQQQVAAAVNEAAGATVVSKSAVNRYAVQMKRFAERNRQARELAAAYLERAGADGQQKMSEVLIHQLRALTFDLMLRLQDLQEGLGDAPEAEVIGKIADLVMRAGRTIRDTEAATDRSTERRRRLLQEAAAQAGSAAQEAGISQSTVDTIRERILGLAS